MARPKYVVREGTVKGQGRYLGPDTNEYRASWVDSLGEATAYSWNPSLAISRAEQYGGRIVCVHVRKVKKKRRITKEQFKAAYEASLGKSGPLGSSLRAALLALGIEVEDGS